ncbi:hypothetical protein ACSVDM_16785 [Nocardia sp. JW2]|uniref:hypothetical protein n=1 Tax=Nocardia sp. JW2 TaxID=3450738 RepID=UPI003F4380BC
MVMQAARVAYDPSGFQEWLGSLTPAGAPSSSEVERRPRVHNVSASTAGSAARAYERVLNGQALDSIAREQVLSATPINGPTTTPQVPTTPQRPPKQETPPPPTEAASPGTVPAPPPPPPAVADPGDGDIKHLIDPPPEPTPAAPPQPAKAAPSVPTQPGITAPPPKSDPLLEAQGPNQDALPMPPTAGREVGQPWDQVLPNGQTVTFTIPEGNGKNTVDAVVRDKDGNVVSTARIVSIEGTAKYIRWQNDANGDASYFESGGPNQLGYGQHFAAGTSTSGLPSHVFETSPDTTRTRTLSIGPDGRVVGVDIGARNEQGLYDNAHIDNFGIATLSSTRFSPDGQLDSKFTGLIFPNQTGWMEDDQGNRWEGQPDKDGNQTWVRVKNGHTYRMNHLGVITDFSLDKDGRPRLDTIFPDGTLTSQSGRTTVHFDAHGKEVWRNEIPAPVQPWDVRAWNATKRGLSGLGSVISDTAGAPFHMMQDGVRGMSSVRVDQYGTFHVTYDAPNRFANAGTAVFSLAKGAAMFYLAVPKYAALKGYDALRGSGFVRGSTAYQPPDREDELVKDLTGIPLKQWKDDTVGSTFEFGATTAAGLILFRSVGIRPRTRLGATGLREFSSGFRKHATGYVSAHSKSAIAMASGFALRVARFGREQVEGVQHWRHRPGETLEIFGEALTTFMRGLVPQVVPSHGTHSHGDIRVGGDRFAQALASARNQRLLPKSPGKPIVLPNWPRRKMATDAEGNSIAVRRRTLEDGTVIELRIDRPRTDPVYTSGYTDGLPVPKKNSDGSWTISLRLESGWNKADFDAKAQYLGTLGASGQLQKMSGQGDPRGSVVRTWRNMKLKEIFYSSRSQSELDARVAELDNQQIDHAHDLQLGGKDALNNMWALDSVTNHGMGGQINSQLLQVPEQGAIIRVQVVG